MAFWRTYYHIVWSTKFRQPLITSEVERRLYPYIVDKATELGAYVYAANGWVDHSHVIAAMPPKIAVADFVRRLKGASAHMINSANLGEAHFQWQRGYGVMTLGQTQLSRAIQYVENQKQHHAEQTTNRWLEEVDNDENYPQRYLKEQLAEYRVSEVGLFP